MLAKPGSLTGRVKFEAEIYVLSKEEGGRHTPFFKNYKPQARGDGRERKRGRDVKREIFERERGCERDGKRERALPQYLQSAGKKREREVGREGEGDLTGRCVRASSSSSARPT